LLNSSPDTTGLIVSSHVKLYKMFGDEIQKRFGKSIKQTSGNRKVLELLFSRPTAINHSVIQEDLRFGQRVTAYKVEGSNDGKTWKLLYKGSSIGHKKIDCFTPSSVRRVRLTILSCKALPHISNFAVYNIPVSVLQKKQEAVTTIGYWQGNTYDTTQWKTLELDLTPYMHQIGQYQITFSMHSYDYNDHRSSGLEFKDLRLQMYGHDMTDAVKNNGANKFLIDRTQQTLNDFPIKLQMLIKSKPCKSAGEITIQRLTY
jgi:alpha-L-fucosidase